MIKVFEAVAVLLLAVAIHEAAHAVALRRHKIPIVEAGLGLPFPPRLIIDSKRLPFTVSVSPWLLGAYVRHSDADVAKAEALPYRERAWWMGAGVVANLVSAFAVGALAAFFVTGRPLLGGAYVALVVLFTVLRKAFVAYLMPLVGLVVLGFLVLAFLEATSAVTGPVGTVTAISEQLNSPYDLMRAFFFISLGLAFFNMIPLYPVDGGRIAGAIVSRFFGERVQRAFQSGAMILAFTLIGYTCINDLFATAG
ncbi:M50 family metallopeptidase [Microbispora sp. NPDC049125]|uniref:M50 family metallopeptidase n=1 Tax=Microbispora sp. NPDC049125 TaxID=3154929 RepID=UPI0034657587